MTAWRAIGSTRWAFDGLTSSHADPLNVTADQLVDSFNTESGYSEGARAVDAYNIDILDHIEVDSDTWESTGTCTLERNWPSTFAGLDA